MGLDEVASGRGGPGRGRRGWLRGAALLVGLAAGLAAMAAPRPVDVTVRVGVEPDYGPFTFRSDDGQVQGLAIDLLTAMQRHGGARLDWLAPQPLAHWLRAAKAGEVDLLLALRPTPERSTFLGFSGPYVRVPAVLALRTGQVRRTGLADLEGRAVGVGDGYAVEGFVRKAYPKVLWTSFPDDAAALAALRRGDLAAVVADAASIRFVLQAQRWTDVEVHDAVGFSYDLAFAWPKGRTDIAEWVQAALREMPPAEREALAKRWVDVEPLRYHGWVDTAVPVALGVLTAAGAAMVLASLRPRRPGAS